MHAWDCLGLTCKIALVHTDINTLHRGGKTTHAHSYARTPPASLKVSMPPRSCRSSQRESRKKRAPRRMSQGMQSGRGSSAQTAPMPLMLACVAIRTSLWYRSTSELVSAAVPRRPTGPAGPTISVGGDFPLFCLYFSGHTRPAPVDKYVDITGNEASIDTLSVRRHRAGWVSGCLGCFWEGPLDQVDEGRRLVAA